MKTDEKKQLTSLVLIWLLVVCMCLFSPKKLAFSYYGVLGSLFALPFGMWAVWHFHRTWKPWVKPNHKQEDIDKGLIISVIGTAVLTGIVNLFNNELQYLLVSFIISICFMVLTYIMIQMIRHRPRK